MNNQRWLSISFLTFFNLGRIPSLLDRLVNPRKRVIRHSGKGNHGDGYDRSSAFKFSLFTHTWHKKMSLIRTMRWMSFASLILALLYLPNSSFIILLTITILFSAIYPIILPAVESSTSILIKTDWIHYGKSRSFGSIGYTVSLVLIGAAMAIWSEQNILYMMIAGSALIWNSV